MSRLRCSRTVRPAFVALAIVLACSGPGQPADAAPSQPEPLRLTALHAEPDVTAGGRVVDALGRQVLLRGVNVNALAEYWPGTAYRTTFPLTGSDADRMAAIGWNAVRLLVSWSRIEPRPGQYDEAYLRRVQTAVDVLGRRGIYTIIDLHQDAWGPTLASHPGQVCPAGTSPALGWDGAPGWATLDGGASRCAPSGIRELSPAVLAAFDAFWADAPGPGGVGVRTRYVRMLGTLASRFARSETVAGYDVMNEPNAFSGEQQRGLADLYGKSLRSVRHAERASHGFSHLVLFEPSALWSATGRGAPPDFARDRNVVYAPHIYTGGFTGGPITRDAFQVALDEARIFGGAPVLSGEWGADPGRAGPGGDRYFLEHQALQDEFQTGATLWTWRESCGDPHKVGDYRAGQVPMVWGQFDVDCRPNRVIGPRRELLTELTRAYPRAVPGRLTSTTYDPRTGQFAASGSAAPARGRLIAFTPSPPASLTSTGLRHVRVVRALGGATYITAQATGGSWTLDVQGRPAP